MENERISRLQRYSVIIAIFALAVSIFSLVWQIKNYIFEFPRISVKPEQTRELLVNPHNNIAFGNITLVNKGFRPLTVLELRGDLLVNSEGVTYNYLLSFSKNILHLEAQKAVAVTLHTYINNISIPTALVLKGKSAATYEKEPRRGKGGEQIYLIEKIQFDTSAPGQEQWLMFFSDQLKGKVRLWITTTQGVVESILEPVVIVKLEEKFAEKEFGKEYPFAKKINNKLHK